MEGADHRFPVLVIAPQDSGWVERVLTEVDARITSNDHWSARQLAAPSRPFNVKRIFRDCLARVSPSERPIPAYAVNGAKPDRNRSHPLHNGSG
jgi:hypothetical protein